MGKPKTRELPDLSHMAQHGAVISVRVTPKAARNAVTLDGDRIKITVTTVPEGGKATADVLSLLARALRVPVSSLRLTHGATRRDKSFVLSLDA